MNNPLILKYFKLKTSGEGEIQEITNLLITGEKYYKIVMLVS